MPASRSSADLSASSVRSDSSTSSPPAFHTADPDEVAQGFYPIEAAFSPIEVFVSNVGILLLFPLAKITHEDFHRFLELNLVAAFHLVIAAVPLITPHGRGRI